MRKNGTRRWGRLILLLAGLAGACGTEQDIEQGIETDEQELAVEPEAPVVRASATEIARMERYLGELQRPQDVRHSFALTTGDLVDCVDIAQQAALRRDGVAGQKVALAPSTAPVASRSAIAAKVLEDVTGLRGDRDAQGRVRACPAGSIPQLRLTIDHLKRFRSLEDFRRKVPSHLSAGVGPVQAGDNLEAVGPTDLHQYAYTTRSVDNWGAESSINLWQPFVERNSEFSLSQIWVTRGAGSNLETVEVGVQKYVNLYGNGTPRLFIYFTPDNYGSGGCYNLSCGAFVQTNSSIVIGGPFSAYSVTGGNQYSFKALWYKDGPNGHWWLRINDVWVGYYPRSRFDANGIRDYADRVTFGGEIIDDVSTRHTLTDMGSGAFPSAGWQYAAYQRNILYVNTSNVYTDPGVLPNLRTDANCYDIANAWVSNWGRYFFYGGSGYNANCL